MRPAFLRQRLLLLAGAGILPLALVGAIAILVLTAQQRRQNERTAVETARALVTAVDAATDASISTLQALASLVPDDGRDLRAFRRTAERVIRTQHGWMAIMLADPAGAQRAYVSQGIGAPVPGVVDAASFASVVARVRPAVGDLARAVEGVYYVPVRVPVVRRGTVRWVLSAAVTPASIVEVLERQRLPADSVASVFDAHGIRVARSRQHAEYLGSPPARSLQELMDRVGDEGYGITTTLEGEPVTTSFSRSRATGWSIAIGVPTAAAEAAGLRSRLTFGAGVLLSVLLAVTAAVILARSIGEPMHALRDAVRAVSEGRRPAWPVTPIHEIRDVSEAFAAATAMQDAYAREREDILRREQSARAAAEAASRAKDEFLAMLGHELRNPLGAISNARRVLDSASADPAAGAHARAVIGRQVDHLARLTDDLLDAARATTGKIVLHRAPVDLAVAVRQALATVRAGAASSATIAESIEPVWIDADPTRIEQIAANLVGNAIKFTPAAGRISVSVGQSGDEAILRVADDGIGMTPELAAQVFEPFVQGERGLDRSSGGLGLGLTLVRRLVELHGGTVTARSDGPNRGSEFVVRLAAVPPPPDADAPSPAGETALHRDLLLVDDDSDGRESLRRLLEIQGHRVRAVADAAAAVAALREAVPEIAIIDIGLPTVDGYELARRIRAQIPAADRPLLVALTGYGMPSDRRRSVEAGFDVHLVKPVELDELDAVLRTGRSGAQARAAGGASVP